MKIIYSEKFTKGYKRLPLITKKQAEKKEKIFRGDPFDQRLKTHKLLGKLKEFWSFSIDYKYRVVFEFKEKGEIWFLDIGGHEVYK